MRTLFDERKDNWQKLETMLEQMRGSSVRRLSRAEVREFGELYRRAAADLAIARAETRDPKLINYLNSLVIRAHGQIYRTERTGLKMLSTFFSRDLPGAFQRNVRYMAIAFFIFAGFAVFGFVNTWLNTDFLHFVSLSGVTEQINANDHWWKDLNDANQIGASGIMSNNILVTMRVFALGALFGVGSIYDLAFEGARLGGVFAACYKLNPPFGNELASFVVGHGVIELSCIFFCAGAGMMIGYAIIDPGDKTRAQALKEKGIDAARIVIGCGLLLVVAGTIEGFISPSDIPPLIKVAIGLTTGILMYSYLFFTRSRDIENGNSPLKSV